MLLLLLLPLLMHVLVGWIGLADLSGCVCACMCVVG